MSLTFDLFPRPVGGAKPKALVRILEKYAPAASNAGRGMPDPHQFRMYLPRSQADNRFDIPEGRGREICRGLLLFGELSDFRRATRAAVCCRTHPQLAYGFGLRLGRQALKIPPVSRCSVRRWMHSLIVALLCLTLFVDTAKACWLRRHRSRSQTCRTATPCQPLYPQHHCGACGESHPLPVTDCCGSDAALESVVHVGMTHETLEHGTLEHGVIEHGTVEHGVIEHGVVEAAPTTAGLPVMPVLPESAAPASDPPASAVPTASVLTTPATPVTPVTPPLPQAAQPMPLATASPALPQPQAAAQEPLPDLKPAVAPPATAAIAPASNEQPILVAPAGAAAPMPPVAAEQPPAPQPEMVLPPKPPVANLFDLLDDEADEETNDAEAAASLEKPSEKPTEEPVEEPMTEEAPTAPAAEKPAIEKPVTEEPATDASAEEKTSPAEAKSDAKPAPAEDTPTDDTPTIETPAAEPNKLPVTPAEPEADPSAAVLVVPREPMRHWRDATGTHHAQGWLVELESDRVRILKMNGRHTTVAIESLSTEDRDYVSVVGGRLAAEQQGITPAQSTTAGL